MQFPDCNWFGSWLHEGGVGVRVPMLLLLPLGSLESWTGWGFLNLVVGVAAE